MIADYLTLCKPRVVAMMLITSWIGMQLATPTLIPAYAFIYGSIGIASAASAAAVINHLIDRHIDSKMLRTASRPIAAGRISITQALLFAFTLGISGILVLYFLVNITAAVLTLGTVIGYAVVYTVFLKRASPQNIVIGGIFGAMPPVLGWATVSGTMDPNALLLALIIFVWTPPHFWALAIYRKDEYAKAKLPMLPITHGIKFTKVCIILYTILLIPCTILPYLTGTGDLIYLVTAIVLGVIFLYRTIKFYYTNDPKQGLYLFSFSIKYLLILFVALLLDNFVRF